ncbi:MAG: hypothetical protein R3Y27_04750 [Clostridia bacterium]
MKNKIGGAVCYSVFFLVAMLTSLGGADISKGEEITSNMIEQITVGSLGLDGVIMNSEDIVGQYAKKNFKSHGIYTANLRLCTLLLRSFDKLKDDEGEIFYTANSESIERFYELDNYLLEIGFKPKEFAAEFKACERDLDLLEWKMNELKVEIDRAEK